MATAERNIELMNVDILPFFDTYNDEEMTFTAAWRAESVLAEDEDNILFNVVRVDDEDQKPVIVAVIKEYFDEPELEQKKTALEQVKSILLSV